MKQKTFLEIAQSIGQIVEDKNQAYGNSFEKSAEFFKLLYPNGIPSDKYADALLLARIFDKCMRIATDKDAFGESPYSDIVGYGILGVFKDMKRDKGNQ